MDEKLEEPCEQRDDDGVSELIIKFTLDGPKRESSIHFKTSDHNYADLLYMRDSKSNSFSKGYYLESIVKSGGHMAYKFQSSQNLHDKLKVFTAKTLYENSANGYLRIQRNGVMLPIRIDKDYEKKFDYLTLTTDKGKQIVIKSVNIVNLIYFKEEWIDDFVGYYLKDVRNGKFRFARQDDVKIFDTQTLKQLSEQGSLVLNRMKMKKLMR